MMRTYSVVVPCYNEEEILKACALRLLDVPCFQTIFLVDDGSTDGTPAICEELFDQHPDRIELLRLSTNHGKNRAIREAVQKLASDVIFIHDADLEIDAQVLVQIVERFEENPRQFVFGSRLAGGMEPGAMAAHGYWGNRFFAKWVSCLVGYPMTDVLCGLKAMPRIELQKCAVSSCRWGDFDLIFGAAEQQLAFDEIAIPYRKRPGGMSKMKRLPAGFRFTYLCLRYTGLCLMRKLRKVFGFS